MRGIDTGQTPPLELPPMDLAGAPGKLRLSPPSYLLKAVTAVSTISTMF